MKRTLMIGVAAGALLAGVNLATAQGMMERQQPGASGGASIEQKGKAETKGQEQKGKAETKGQLKAQGSGELKAQSGSEQKGGKARAQAQGDMKPSGELKAQDQKPDEKKMKGEKGKSAQSKDQLKSGSSAQGDTKARGSETTGQAAGGGAKASLSTEQKTKIRETVFKSGPRVTKVNFSISVGTVVPRTVRFAVLPPILVEVYPQWRGYEYFIVEEEIIIVEPRTLRIVAVIRV